MIFTEAKNPAQKHRVGAFKQAKKEGLLFTCLKGNLNICHLRVIVKDGDADLTTSRP